MYKVNYSHKFLGAAFLGVAITCIISVGLFISVIGIWLIVKDFNDRE